jgi:hypothetical protein
MTGFRTHPEQTPERSAMRIDVHSHFIDLEFTKHLQGRASMPRTVLEGGVYVVQCATGWHLPTLPNIVDMDVKLRDMRRWQPIVRKWATSPPHSCRLQSHTHSVVGCGHSASEI